MVRYWADVNIILMKYGNSNAEGITFESRFDNRKEARPLVS